MMSIFYLRKAFHIVKLIKRQRTFSTSLEMTATQTLLKQTSKIFRLHLKLQCANFTSEIELSTLKFIIS
jgi:hypothetical protein